MSDSILKTYFARFPEPNWYEDLDWNRLSKTELIDAISQLLSEYGKFPVPWSGYGTESGLFVVGSNGRYIGHWLNSEADEGEATPLSIASEDLGDLETATQVIFQKRN